MGLLDRYTEKALAKLLAENPQVRELQKTAPVDLAAVLTALATVESSRDPKALGDHVAGVPHAFGLFQINDRVWSVDKGRVLGDVTYQISLAVEVMRQALGTVARALTRIRRLRDAGVKFDFKPDRDIPGWINVAWQYGAGGANEWLQLTTDFSSAGFSTFRNEQRVPVKPVEAGYAKRAATFRLVHDSVRADSPSILEDVAFQSGKDLYTIGSTGSLEGTALGTELEQRGLHPRKLLEELAAKLKDYFVAWALLGVLVLAAFAFLVFMFVRWEAGRARTFTRSAVEPAARARLKGAT